MHAAPKRRIPIGLPTLIIGVGVLIFGLVMFKTTPVWFGIGVALLIAGFSAMAVGTDAIDAMLGALIGILGLLYVFHKIVTAMGSGSH